MLSEQEHTEVERLEPRWAELRERVEALGCRHHDADGCGVLRDDVLAIIDELGGE